MSQSEKDRVEKYEIPAGAVAPFGATVERNVDTGEVLSVKHHGGDYKGDSPYLGKRTLSRVIAPTNPATPLGVESAIVTDAAGDHEERTEVASLPRHRGKTHQPDVTEVNPLTPAQKASAKADLVVGDAE